MTALTLEFFCDWVSAENLGGTSRSPAATTPRRHLHVRYPFSLGIKSRFARSYHRGKDMPELLAAIGRQPAHQSLNWACWKGGQSMFKLGEAGMMRNSNPEYTALRRTFLKGSLAAGAAVAGTNSLTPGAAVAGGRLEEPHQPSAAGLIIRQKEPNNLEMPFDLLESYLTPTELFYIRNHFPPPSIDPAGYRLTIDGAVSKPLALSYRELRDLPSETRIATLECAGNGRVFLIPQVRGAQWELGAVGNAEWTGVPLRALLERAGLEDDARDVVLEGADRGTPTEEPKPPSPISYARSIPREKALQPEILIAYQMNGRDLSRDHGYPVRAIVPGHYGMASVKWLTRIQAVREPFQGYWQTSDYGYWDVLDGTPIRRPLAEMKLKSTIARPRVYETVLANQKYSVFGAAWAGETDVTEIAVSGDGGQTWAEAHFVDPARRHAWRRWEFDWLTPKQPGRYTLLSRAKDVNGIVQPNEHDWNYSTYVINHLLPIEVIVADGMPPER